MKSYLIFLFCGLSLVAHRVTLGEGRFVDDIFPGEQKSLIAS
jgi:hypothetical protein